MTNSYLRRVTLLIMLIVGLLLAVGWLTPGNAGRDRWLFYKIGTTSFGSKEWPSELKFARANSVGGVDAFGSLPGSLALLPARPRTALFGQKEPSDTAAVEAIVQPEECVLVRSVHFTARNSASGQSRRILVLDRTSDPGQASARLGTVAAPPQCPNSLDPACGIEIWVEARPKNCN